MTQVTMETVMTQVTMGTVMTQVTMGTIITQVCGRKHNDPLGYIYILKRGKLPLSITQLISRTLLYTHKTPMALEKSLTLPEKPQEKLQEKPEQQTTGIYLCECGQSFLYKK